MFDAMGRLFPGFHDWTIDELKANLVAPFSSSTSRPRIIRGFELLRGEMGNLISDAEQWVDGSFATNKLDPGDLDLLNLIDKDTLDNLPPTDQARLQALVNGPNTKGTHDCDSYYLVRVPDTHPHHTQYRQMRTYWMGEFGFDRDDKPKGIVRLQLNGANSMP